MPARKKNKEGREVDGEVYAYRVGRSILELKQIGGKKFRWLIGS